VIHRGADGGEFRPLPGPACRGKLTMTQRPGGPQGDSGDDRFEKHARYHTALDGYVESQVLLLRAGIRLAQDAAPLGVVAVVMKQLAGWSGLRALHAEAITREHAPWTMDVLYLLSTELDRVGMAAAGGLLRDAAALTRRQANAVKPRLGTMSLEAATRTLEAGAADQRTSADQLNALVTD
jgi:hypothetical protein